MAARPSAAPASPSRSTVIFSTWLLALYRRPGAFLTSVLVVPLLSICLWLYVVSERQWRAREGEDLLVAARLASRAIQEELVRTLTSEAAIAARPNFAKAVAQREAAAIKSDLRTLLDLAPRADRLLVLDGGGKVVADLSDAPGRAGSAPIRDPARRVSGVYLRDPDSGDKAVSVSSPVVDGRDVVGHLEVEYRLNEIARWLRTIRVEPAGFVYVVDHQGWLVAHPYQLLPGRPKNVSAWAPVSHPVSPRGTLVRFADGRPARRWTAAVVNVQPFGWRVVAQQPDAAMLRPFSQLVGCFAALIAMLMIVIGALVLRWTRLHEATLGLLAQQARLLKHTERRLTRTKLRRGNTP